MTVVVVGNAVVDVAYQMDHLPRPGETVLARERTVDVGGKGLNQAIMARRAGAEVRFCARLADDTAAATIRTHFEAEGLSTAWLISVACATDESIIYVADSGENCVVSTNEAARRLAPADAEAALVGLAPGDVVLLQGNLSQALTGACLARARTAGATTILNPAPIAFDHAGLWPMVDIAVLNQAEAELLTGEVEIGTAAAALRSRGAGKIVLTLGPRGALVLEGQQPQHVPTEAVTAVDTTGAGDVLAGVLAAAIDRGLGLIPAVRWAVAAASRKATRRGTSSAFPSRSELAVLAAAMDLP